MATRAPRRGEPGFAAAQRAAGGDPRLQEARRRRQQAAAPPEPAEDTPKDRPGGSGRQRRSSGRGRAPAQTLQRIGATRVPATRVSIDDGAGVILGLFAWVLTVQYLRGGPAAVRRWFRAKWLNEAG